MGPPKNRAKKKKGFAKGNPRHRKAKVCKKDPCPMPKACEKRDPQDYETWEGTREITLTKYAHLNEVVEWLIDVKDYMLAFYREERKDLKENFKDLKKYEVSEFNLHLLGEKVLGKTVTTSRQATECVSWRYTEWEYKKELSEEESMVYDEEYPDRYEEKFFTWTGDDSAVTFKIEGLSSAENKAITDNDLWIKVVVGDEEKQPEDYSIDPQKGTITFVEPPGSNVGIRADFSFPKRGPGHPTKGSCLEVARYPTKIDTGKIYMGKFLLSSSRVKESTVAVIVDGQGWDGEYEVSTEVSTKAADVIAGNLIRCYVVFKGAKIPKSEDEIVVVYADMFDVLTEDYVKVAPEDFEATRQEALNNLDFFFDLVRHSNTTKYDKLVLSKDKIDLKMVRSWIEIWHSYYPSRELKERERIHKIAFYCRCNNSNCSFEGQVRPVTQSFAGEHRGIAPACDCTQQTEIVVLFTCPSDTCTLSGKHFPLDEKDEEAPKCAKCGAQTELLTSLYETTVQQTVVLNTLEEVKNGKITEQLETPYDLKLFPVYFETARPKPGDPDSENEEVMLSKESMRMDEVANQFLHQLLIIKNEAKVRRLPIIRYWGFADKRGKCDFNDSLSLRRADWVKQQLEHILMTKHFLKIENGILKIRKSERSGEKKYVEIARYPDSSGKSELIGCGEGLADIRDKKGGYKPEEHRSVIIETWLLEPKPHILK